ncbi:MAG: DUF192 domain-containing protein [Deltaproteobacteria bacterium]|nr:DUF192 domain-containing protein [Deltaproteobacteria bacterium]
MITEPSSRRIIARQIEWMKTSKSRAIGMLKFDQPPQNFGAIFKLPLFGFFPLVHTIGMKFPIDILFCDSQKKVLHRYEKVKPGRFIFPMLHAVGGCSYLLEFSNCDISNIRKGVQLEWPEENPKEKTEEKSGESA